MTARRSILCAAMLVFVGLAFAPTTGLLDGSVGGDASVYQAYGERIADGEIPYRGFFMEYPPGAIPAFAAPTVAGSGHYLQLLKLLMLACALACLPVAAVVLERVGADLRRTAAALGLLALTPLLLGPVLTTHYDPWPALLTALAVAALLTGRPLPGFVLLGVAAAAKVYPVVLLPVALVAVARPDARRGALGFLAGLAVFVAPFAVLAPGGLRFSLEFETRRPLQIESLGSSLLLAAHHLGFHGAHRVTSHGSINLGGTAADAAAAATTVAELAALAAVYVLFARGPRDGESLVLASAAAVTATVALGKVLSPQYVVWLIPLAFVVRGRAAALLAAAALVLTRLLLRWHEIAFGREDWVVLGRDLVLVALLAVLLSGLRRPPSTARGASART